MANIQFRDSRLQNDLMPTPNDAHNQAFNAEPLPPTPATKPDRFSWLKRSKPKTEAPQDELNAAEKRTDGRSQTNYLNTIGQTNYLNTIGQTDSNKLQEEKREVAKTKAKVHHENKKAREAEERARKQFMGGVAWGFDPTAGMRFFDDNAHDNGCFVSSRNCDPEGTYEVDNDGRHTGRRWTRLGTWGIEHGGPGREGTFEHGALKDKEMQASSSQR